MPSITPDASLPVRRSVEGVSVRDVVNILFRRKWVIIVISLPIIVIGSASLFGQTGSYTAASRVVVELTKADLPRWNTNGRNVDYDRELSTLLNIAMSVPVIEAAAEALKDSIPVIERIHPARLELGRPGQLQEFLMNGIDVAILGESSILEFRFSSAHARISLMAVGALRNAFIEYQINGRKSVKAVAFYEEQLVVVRSEIDSLLTVRGDVLNRAGYSSLADELRYDSGQLANIEGQLSDATVARRTLQLEYRRLRQYLDGDPRDFPMGPDENRSMTLVYWMNMVAKHEDELNSILTLHTDESNPAKRQRELIASSVDKLAQEERKYVESIRLALESLIEKEKALQNQTDIVRTKNSKGPAVYQRISLLDAELKSLRTLLEDIQGKRGEVRLGQLADERVSSVMVLSEPELVAVLSGGKTVVYFALIFVFALALGAVVAFIAENMDHRVYTPADVEENLKLPVFASVTRAD